MLFDVQTALQINGAKSSVGTLPLFDKVMVDIL